MSFGRRKTYVGQLSVNGPAEDLGDLGIIDRDRDDLVALRLHIFRNVKSRLPGMRLRLEPEHRDRFRFADQVGDVFRGSEDVFLPVHKRSLGRPGQKRDR